MNMDEVFFYNGNFYSEIDEIIDDATDDFYSESDMPENFSIEYEDCDLKPIFKLDSELLYELISGHFEENSTEDGNEWDCVRGLIEKHINFDAINSEAPKLYFPNGKIHTISREEILSNIKERGGFYWCI